MFCLHDKLLIKSPKAQGSKSFQTHLRTRRLTYPNSTRTETSVCKALLDLTLCGSSSGCSSTAFIISSVINQGLCFPEFCEPFQQTIKPKVGSQKYSLQLGTCGWCLKQRAAVWDQALNLWDLTPPPGRQCQIALLDTQRVPENCSVWGESLYICCPKGCGGGCMRVKEKRVSSADSCLHG